ncbi:hypothetical protein FB565_005039 [Actinoplanes lutulentus]|uniref:Uncharacterized protein n=1 Tax=Actinoplanes lutulentus TaxID=1287878 RepID=A0A327ZJC7_9ACTN|nr:hypothetical protein [Actinoplanes lutulentus]RAK40559.1 hypothetical protein B0I29_103597 [Actinoplanes lutulentus]
MTCLAYGSCRSAVAQTSHKSPMTYLSYGSPTGRVVSSSVAQ